MKRPTPVPESKQDRPGRVGFDERGNAIYQWSNEEAQPEHLENPNLKLADEEAWAAEGTHVNPKAAVHGYNPYGSGLIPRDGPLRPRKRDLKELSKWIEQKKRTEDAGGD